MQSEKHKNTCFPRSKETKASALPAHIEKRRLPDRKQRLLSYVILLLFAEQTEHIFLIHFHARLIKRIHVNEIGCHTDRSEEEIDQITERMCAHIRDFDQQIRHLSGFHMGFQCSFGSHLIDPMQVLAAEIIHLVHIFFIAWEDQILTWLRYIDDRFKQYFLPSCTN